MEQIVSTCFEASPRFAAFLQDNVTHLELQLKRINCHLTNFPGELVEISHPRDISSDYLQMYLLEHYSNFELKRVLGLHDAALEGKSTRLIHLNSIQNLVIMKYQEWISMHSGLAALVFNPDRTISLYGSMEAVEKGTKAINDILCQYSLNFATTAKQHPGTLRLPSRFANQKEDKASPLLHNFSDEDDAGVAYDTNSEGIDSLLEGPNSFQNLQTSSPKSRQDMFQDFNGSHFPRSASASNSPLYVSKPYMFQNHTDNISSHGSRSPLSSLSPAMPVSSVDSMLNSLPIETSNIRGSNEGRVRLMFMVKSCEAPRLIGSRGANKKKLEQITGCHLMFHTENRKEGRFPIEISGSSDELIQEAKQIIIAYLESDATAPGHEMPSKTRSPAKIMLQLSPKKRSETGK